MITKRKTLKFEKDLVPLVLSGYKNCTWRLWDDKNLQTGDLIDLIKRPELNVFAEAKIISVIEKPFGKLGKRDKLGHESFESNKKMYENYSHYYNRPVDSNTIVKIIKFKVLKSSM